MEKQIFEVYLSDIIPNRFQPREKFNNESIEELSKSIQKYGVIQPLVLRRIGDKYEIIAGERRYKASKMAGLEKVPAVIKELNDEESAEVALIENLQREDLTAIEKARSYKKLLAISGETQDQLATKLGISQPALANTIRLLSLDEMVQKALLERTISERHARSLLKLESKEKQRELLNKIINERLTVRKLDSIINGIDDDSGESDLEKTIRMTPILDKENQTEENNMNNEMMQNPETIREVPRERIIEPIQIIPSAAPTSPAFQSITEPAVIEPVEQESLIVEEPKEDTINNEELKLDKEMEPEIMPAPQPVAEPVLNPLTPEPTSSPVQDVATKPAASSFEDETPVLEAAPIRDIETIKENAKDIIGDNGKPDFDMLLQPDKTETPQVELPKEKEIVDFPRNEVPNLDEEAADISNLEENKFITEGFDTESEPDEGPISVPPMPSPLMQQVTMPQESKNIPVEPQDSAPDSEDSTTPPPGDLRVAINTIRRTVDIIENNGLQIEAEEMDMEGEYRFVIKISKQK